MIGKTLGKIYMGLIILFMYAPILVLITLSFNSSRSRVVWGGFTFKWYRTLFENSTIMNAFAMTMLLAVLSAGVATVIGLFAALGIYTMRKREYKVMLFFTNIPLLNADIVTGIALMLWFVRFLPLGFTSVLVAHITFNIPYVILCILPKLETMDLRQFEAARDLGATGAYAFVKIIIPDLLPGILAGFFMAVTMSMDDFVITYFTKGPGVNTISTLVYGEIRKGIKPEMYALSSVLFLLVLVILVIINILARPADEKTANK
ncbi:MAG: ABC transporter permease [Lachnospiraceae bacterium]|nr:ABC transporter permease [Lachnospiraceae bacterium]